MSTRVVTMSTCDRCGAVDEREGMHTNFAVGWKTLRMGNEPATVLCPVCVSDVRFVLDDKPVARVPPARQEEAPGETGQSAHKGAG